MNLIQVNHDPTRRQLNVFGVLWLFALGAVGGVMLVRGRPPLMVGTVWVLAVLVPVVGWIVPAVTRVVYLGMTYLTLPIGLVVSYTVLALVYYGVLTPAGRLMRLVGHDPMQRRFDTTADTYWVACQDEDDARRFFRQF